MELKEALKKDFLEQCVKFNDCSESEAIDIWNWSGEAYIENIEEAIDENIREAVEAFDDNKEY